MEPFSDKEMSWNELSIQNLPPFNVPCIVFGEDRIDIAVLRMYTVVGGFEKISYDFTEYNSSYSDYPYNVTHWMELPEPPKL